MLVYRPDIDGLRAIAVLSVLFYHLNETLLTGGFVGVDIFFVISGYLITKLIAKEITETKQFSFGRFYIRRIRRLLPAMCVMFLFCLFFVYWLFPPAHLAEFGQSMVCAVLSVSNFFFWNSTGYFDSVNEFKPLLHTWSLSVEEQFYMLWPLTLVLLFKFRSQRLVLAFICVVGLISLFLNDYFFSNQSYLASLFEVKDNQSSLDIAATVFYLLPFRVFEFAIGAILVFSESMQRTRWLSRWLRECLFVLGIAFIVIAIVTFDSDMQFPSYSALLPCLGAGLIIFSGPSHRLVTLLSNSVMVAIGLISYSLYLIHWPIIVFYKYWREQSLENMDYIVVVLLSLILAYLMYRFVEQPFRKPKINKPKSHNNKRFLVGSLSIVCVLLMIGINAHASSGWLWRYPTDLVKQLSNTREDYTKHFWDNLTEYETEFLDNGKPKVLVIGDSMAADLLNALVSGGSAGQLDLISIAIGENCRGIFPLTDIEYRKLYAGLQGLCRVEHNKVLLNMNKVKNADTVILASYWWELGYLKYIDRSAAYLNDNGVPHVMVMGMKNQQSDGIPFLARHIYDVGLTHIRTPLNQHVLLVNRMLKQYAQNYEYFDLLNQFCNEEGCKRVTDDGSLIIFDGTHMTQQGAEYVGKNLGQAPWFKKIMDSSNN